MKRLKMLWPCLHLLENVGQRPVALGSESFKEYPDSEEPNALDLLPSCI